ncbi:DUF4440 domain-containing protein [Phenylobacterium sp.]|uniref:DUF4440 domain-containing protein n=1 Tax=Phenylobacterium sp. TaxID=1871053 RepID=UPI0025D3DC5B|nr:DUF4440 domain-containing protein [Phenylobacterium sp.]
MFAAAALAAALSTAPPDCATLQRSARPAIGRANRDWPRAIQAGDAAAIAAAYADDGILVAADGAVVRGREAVRALYAGAPPAAGGRIRSLGLACGGGGLLYEWGVGTIRTLGADGRERTRAGRYVTVWAQVGGEWRIVRNLAF